MALRRCILPMASFKIIPAQRHKLAGPQAVPVGNQDSRGIPMPPPVIACRLHQALNLALGQVFPWSRVSPWWPSTLSPSHCYIGCADAVHQVRAQSLTSFNLRRNHNRRRTFLVHVLCGPPDALQRFFCDSLASHNSLFAKLCNTFQKSPDSSYTVSYFGRECS